jgi:murein DD-endopeptidase MepM/ murein hydrolase activator NlpD
MARAVGRRGREAGSPRTAKPVGCFQQRPRIFVPFSHAFRGRLASPRAFASNRNNGLRAHAGCDLYFEKGTWIYAIGDGRVTRGPYPFYCQTFALEVDHGDFLARYGEIQAKTTVKEGDKVYAGEQIARVGHLVGIQVPSDMLHLELYDKSASGPLTITDAARSKKRSDGIPFMRRKDLIDPTSRLNQWQGYLPQA